MPQSLKNRACPNCGSPDLQNREGGIRCASCNSSLRWSGSGTDLVIVTVVQQCPLCSETAQPGLAYCRSCGTLLAEACPRCGHLNPVEAAYCGTCRYPLGRTAGECPRCGHVQPAGDPACERCDLPLSNEPVLEVTAPPRIVLGPLRARIDLSTVGQRQVVLARLRRLGLLMTAAEATIRIGNSGGRMLRVQVTVPRGFSAPAALSVAAGEESQLTIRPKLAEAVRWRRGRGTVRAIGGRYQGLVALRSNGGELSLPISMRILHSEPIPEAGLSPLWAWWWGTVEQPSTHRGRGVVRTLKVFMVLLIMGLIIGWASVLMTATLR